MRSLYSLAALLLLHLVGCSDATTSTPGQSADAQDSTAATPCEEDVDCPNGGHCLLSNSGELHCSPCPQCGDGQRCEPSSGDCVQQCDGDSLCPQGSFCLDGGCVEGCVEGTTKGCCEPLMASTGAEVDVDASPDGDADVSSARAALLCSDDLSNVICVGGTRCVVSNHQCNTEVECSAGYICPTSQQCTLVIVEVPPIVDPGPDPCVCSAPGCTDVDCVACTKPNDCGAASKWRCEAGKCVPK